MPKKNIAPNCPNEISKGETPNLASSNKRFEKKLSVKNVTDALKAGMLNFYLTVAAYIFPSQDRTRGFGLCEVALME